MKVMSIFGTRPEMIKMWGTLKKLDDLNFEHVMVHTGQNFTPELKDFFFRPPRTGPKGLVLAFVLVDSKVALQN